MSQPTRTVIYTFATNPYLQAFISNFPELFIFKHLSSDLEKLKVMLQQTKPTHLIGVAYHKHHTLIESKTVNIFNTTKKVSKQGKAVYTLSIPEYNTFIVNTEYTDSFCNWTMYRIQEYLESINSTAVVSFIHFTDRDLSKVEEYLKNAQRV